MQYFTTSTAFRQKSLFWRTCFHCGWEGTREQAKHGFQDADPVCPRCFADLGITMTEYAVKAVPVPEPAWPPAWVVWRA